jgi:protein involved in polysaccharide export with SLBB domain
MALSITDAYVTNAGADASSALGAATVKADTLIVVAHKAAATANTGTVYLRKASGSVKIPLEPGDVLSVGGADGEEFTLDQWEIHTVTAGDGCGYITITNSPFS